jgi:hypothetical protein
VTDKERAIKVIRMTVAAILDAAEHAGPTGAPSGIVYAVMLQFGMTLDMYQQIIAALTDTGRITVHNDCICIAISPERNFTP